MDDSADRADARRQPQDDTAGQPAQPDPAPDLTGALFAAPPAATRPKYRWWMPLAFTEDAELVAELRQMRAAGAGGAEVAAFEVDGAGNDQNPFLSEYGFGTPRWVRKVETMLAAANEEGLALDLTIGPRWPVIVPTVTDVNDPAALKMLIFAREFHPGGSTRGGPLPTNFDHQPPAGANTTLVAVLVARCTVPGTSDSSPPPRLLVRSTVRDVTEEVAGDDTLSITFPGDESETYALIVFRYAPTGFRLTGLTPTTPNYVLDILSAAGPRAIADFYDSAILTPAVRELLRLSGGADLFEDSLELGESQKWTDTFVEEWTARRGYSPLTVLPALAGAGQQGMNTEAAQFFDFDDGSGPRIRTDYRHTHSDIYVANHLDGLRSWASTRSLRTRIQPYGIPIDTSEAAAHIDVPEGETLAFGAWVQEYSNIENYKVVASGAHVAGVPVVSSEACAFVGSVWATIAGGDTGPRSSLRAMYLGFTGGVTQVIWHGFPYLVKGPPGSGAQARWPGMSYGGNSDYAEAWGAKGGPNWADYRLVNDALARIQLAMRQGAARFDCAVYRHDFGMNATWTTGVGDDTLLRSASELAAAGYTYSYLAPAHLLRADAGVRDRTLFPDSGGYRALILRKQTTMTVAAAEAILGFAREGLPVMVVGDPPAHLPGLDPSGAQDARLRDIVEQLMAEPSTHTVAEDEELPDALRALSIEPAAAPVAAPGSFLTLRRHTESVDYYLLLNPTGVPVRQSMRFAGQGRPYLLDIWTGEITVLPDSSVELAGGDVAVVAVTARDDDTFAPAEPPWPQGMLAEAEGADGSPEPLLLDSWSLVVESWTPGPSGVPGDTVRTELGAVPVTSDQDGTLPAWTAITTANGYPEDLADVSGIGTYTANVTLDDDWCGVTSAHLDLGAVVDTVRVEVNGHDLPPVNQLDRRHVEVGPYLRPGRNTVVARVASTLLNAVRVAPDTGASGRARMDCGLFGPVVLTPRASRRNPLLAVEALQRVVPLAKGGYNEVMVTVLNGSPRSSAVTIAASAAAGVTATPEPAQVTLASGESTVVIVKLRNASLDTGTSSVTVTASAAGGPSASATSTLTHSGNLAQNPNRSVLPRLYGSASQDFFPPDRAVDGRPDTFWVARGRAVGQGPTEERPIFFTVDFGAQVQIGTVTLHAGSQADYGARDYAIQTADDGRTWTTVAEVVNAPRGTSTTTFQPVRARFLRLRITATLDPLPRNVQIAELVVTP